MTELVFIEGVSGVGKSTMVRMLSEELKAYGYNVKSYVEFDYNNPIDFYCTAYLSAEEYERLITKYVSVVDVMRVNTHALIKRYGKTMPPVWTKPTILLFLMVHYFIIRLMI